MANKKSTGKKTKKKSKLKKASAIKRKAAKKTVKKAAGKKLAGKKAVAKKTASKAAAGKTRAIGTQSGTKTKKSPKKQTRGDNRIVDAPISLGESRARSGGQSGDLQGLSDVDQADSESVDELLEEGNAFEADIVAGVEHAGDSEGREVHTHEVSEDDVPGEYLDED